MKMYQITQYNEEGAIILENVSFASIYRVKAWIIERYPEAPPLKISDDFLDILFGVIAKTTDPVSGMEIKLSSQETSGPDWRAIAMSLWASESEEEKVINDFGSIAIASATWPEDSIKQKFRETDPEEILYQKVELIVE